MKEKIENTNDIPKEYLDALRNDGNLFAVDEAGLIKDILFYDKKRNKITIINSLVGLKLFTIHGYAVKYLIK